MVSEYYANHVAKLELDGVIYKIIKETKAQITTYCISCNYESPEGSISQIYIKKGETEEFTVINVSLLNLIQFVAIPLKEMSDPVLYSLQEDGGYDGNCDYETDLKICRSIFAMKFSVGADVLNLDGYIQVMGD